MNFTREDILKIQNALLQLGKKDSEFKDADTPLNSDDYIAILQDGINKKVSINNLLSTLGLLKKDDFINVSDRYDEYYILLSEAVTIIAKNKRKRGLVITFQDLKGDWKIYQFKGGLNQWNQLDLWEDLFDWGKFVIDSILPDEEDLTKSLPDEKGNSYLSLKDRTYGDGMGYVILRKNKSFAEQVTKENTIYEIRYDYDLNNTKITIPEGCVLKFVGGKLNNGIVNGNDFCIDSPLKKIFDRIIFTGNCIKNIYELDWFVGNKNLFCDLTSAKKDSTIEVQAAFDSGVMNIHISNQFCYYISSTLVLKSWVSLVGNKISFTRLRDSAQGEPSFYTDQVITIIKVVGDSDLNNKIQKKIVLDNVHLRHYGPIGENDYHIETPVLYITNGTGVNSQVWGINLNVDILVADRMVPSLNRYRCGYTGIEIYADNGFYLTDINIDGEIVGCRRGVYIYTDGNGGAWVNEIKLGFNSTCVWGGQIDTAPVRITGDHQTLIQLTKEELDENPYYFKVISGINTGMIWDLYAKETVGETTYYNVTEAFYASSSNFFDFINNSNIETPDNNNTLPVGNNFFRWTSENLWKLLPLSCNILERTFNNIIGWQKTDNIASGVSYGDSAKEKGMVESIRLYDSNENYIDLTEDSITNYNKLFTLGGYTEGNSSNMEIDSCGCMLKDVSNGYTNFEACFLYSKKLFSMAFSQDSYFCVFLPANAHGTNHIFIEIEYCDDTDTVLERKRFTFSNRDDIYYTKLYLRYAKMPNSNTAYTYVRLRCRDNTPKDIYSKIAKFGILNKIFSDNAITSSGGEVAGTMCFRNVKYDLRTSPNGARYVHNAYINNLVSIQDTNYNSKVLNISVIYMGSVYVTFVKEDSGIGIIKITKTSVSCSDKSISCKLEVHNDKYVGRYLLSLKSINPTSIYICDVFSIYSVKFISVDETHESGYFDATYYSYACPTSGTTTNRPEASLAGIGFTYFDTNLGKMIVSNGTAWINMDGSELI